ncbi:MAG: hypothetical protein WAS55_05410 [Saprospiraceae bacterium]
MNLSEQNKWMDKIFRKKLGNYEMHAESHIWDNIAKRLDDQKRRPVLFGSWWTIFLSTLIVILVTGAGAFLLYKYSKQFNLQLQENKDLPFNTEAETNAGTASLNLLKEEHNQKNLDGINYSKTKNNTVEHSKLDRTSVNNSKPNTNQVKDAYNTDIFVPTVAANQSTTTENTIDDANKLIVSSDRSFYDSGVVVNEEVNYNNLQIQVSTETKESANLKSPALLDGCNVYKNTNYHFFIDAYYAPELANRSLKTVDPSLSKYLEERANSEQPIMSYSVGLRASYVLSNGLSLRGGISISNNKERFDFVKERQKITIEIKDKDGNLVRTEIKEIVIMDKIYNHYKFIDIPLLVGYEKDLKDFILSVNGGIGLNISASQSGKIYKPDIKTVYDLANNGEANTPIFKKNAGLSVIGSIGLNYKYNERILLLLEPSARYYVRSLSDPSNPISQNYLFLGMNLGLRYRIK